MAHEDDPIYQRILSTFMKRRKLKYDVASNGEQAVLKWNRGEFDMILVRTMPLITCLRRDNLLMCRWISTCPLWTVFRRPQKSGYWRSKWRKSGLVCLTTVPRGSQALSRVSIPDDHGGDYRLVTQE